MPVKRVIDRHLVVDDMFGTNSVAVNLRLFAEDIRGIYKIEGEIHEKIIGSEVWASRHIKFFVLCGGGCVRSARLAERDSNPIKP